MVFLGDAEMCSPDEIRKLTFPLVRKAEIGSPDFIRVTIIIEVCEWSFYRALAIDEKIGMHKGIVIVVVTH